MILNVGKEMELFIYGYQQLGYGRDELEDQIEEYLGDSGEVTGAGAGESGWNLDNEVNPDLTDCALTDFLEFLRNQKVPSGTKIDCCYSNGSKQIKELG